MPMPSMADVHINVPLTNVSIAYIQNASNFIATKVFPSIPVDNRSNLYWKYSKSDWRRTDVQRRAPSTESVGSGWATTMDSYFCHVYAVHKDIDDQLRANADSTFRLDSDATSFVTNQLLLKRDLDWTASFFRTGVWGTDLNLATTGSNAELIRWDRATSDPIGLFGTLNLQFIQQTGFKPNTVVFGANVLKALKNHPAIIDRIKYTQRGIVSTDLIATLLDVERVFAAYATINTGPAIPDAKAQDAAGTNTFIADPNSVLLCYVPSSPSVMTPSAGYTFNWRGYLGGNAQGVRIKRFREERIESDRVEGSMTYDMKVVSPDCGVFISNVVGNAA